MNFRTGILRLLTPTDCIKDRLSHYFHWGDKQGLEQALMVAETFPVDVDELARWSQKEGMQDKFDNVRDRFLNTPSNNNANNL
jgi:hypothetical protein